MTNLFLNSHNIHTDFLTFITLLLQFYFGFTLFVVETTINKLKVRKVVLLKNDTNVSNSTCQYYDAVLYLSIYIVIVINIAMAVHCRL